MASGRFRGGGRILGFHGTPFGLELVLRSTDDRLNGNPLSAWRTKKPASMAYRSIPWQKSWLKMDGLIGKTQSFSLKHSKMGVILIKSGHRLNFSRSMLQQNPPSRNPASATDGWTNRMHLFSEGLFLLDKRTVVEQNVSIPMACHYNYDDKL